MNNTLPTTLICMSMLLFCTACSESDRSDGPQPVPAGGQVRFDSKPLKDAILTFQPVNVSFPASVARSLADGSFTLTTGDKGSGAVPGDYKISVSAIVYEGRGHSGSLEDGSYNAGAKPAVARSIIPEKYSNPDSSGLTITIPPEGNRNIVIDLE